MSHSTISTPRKDHALVIGGSIAGLLAAQVLSKYFSQVTIVERDSFPDQPEQRPGVPQAQHLHVLLKRGEQILEQLFPGIEAELTSAGVPTVNFTADLDWLGVGGWAPHCSSDLIALASSRNMLEWIVRRRLAACERVVFVQAGQVTGLLSNASRTGVTGVRVRLSKSDGTQDSAPTEVDLAADLVVDASGRNSRAPQWLEAMGYEPPQQTVINSFLGYASCWYQSPPRLSSDRQYVYVLSTPPYTRGGVMFTVEGNRWVVTLIGVGRDYPPTDEAGFLSFARSLRSPIIHEAIKDAQPVSPIYAYQRTENRLRHYERMPIPEGFVLVGDAVCAFNPVYGQGMTAAALGALTLERCLNQQLSSLGDGNLIGLSRRFQKQLSKVNAVPWLMTTCEDLRWSTTEGGKPNLMTRLMQWYLDQVMLLQAENAEIHKAFLAVMHLIAPPKALFQPNISLQVLKRVVNSHKKDERFAHRQDVATHP